MKRKNTDDLGVFNVLLIGRNPHAVSIADNIHARFLEPDGNNVKNECKFNIIEDLESDTPSNSWFNEFIFDLAMNIGKYNNIVLSARFKEWMCAPKSAWEGMYMKLLLRALNFVVIDISNEDEGEYQTVFDYSIPHCHFNSEVGFLADVMTWIDGQYNKLLPKMDNIRLIRSLSGKGISYLGDVFGCLSGKKYEHIVKIDTMRFDAPILFDELCHATRNIPIAELDKTVVTRSNSMLASFLK